MRSFELLMRQVMESAKRFGHREHVHLTWLAVRRHGTAEAIRVVSVGIRTTARYAGHPQKYNATVSRAWVELVAFHLAQRPASSFDNFVAGTPDLLDKRLLARFYHPATLATRAARVGWVAPDRSPFPWAAHSDAPA
jgi:hypothetical protein